MKKIVIIHTVKATLNTLPSDIKSNTSIDAEIYNIYDDFFAQVNEESSYAKECRLRLKRLELIISSAELIKPDAIIVACSTLSLEAACLKESVRTPVITIDDAMIDHVTDRESSIVLLATSPNPVCSVMTRLRESAIKKGRQISIKPVVCEEALPYLLSNDIKGMKEKVLECVKNEVPNNMAVVLAQNSSGFLKADIERITGSAVYCAAEHLYSALNDLFSS